MMKVLFPKIKFLRKTYLLGNRLFHLFLDEVLVLLFKERFKAFFPILYIIKSKGGNQLHFKKNLLSNLTFELTFEQESNLASAIFDVEVLSKKAGQI